MPNAVHEVSQWHLAKTIDPLKHTYPTLGVEGHLISQIKIMAAYSVLAKKGQSELLVLMGSCG